MRGRFRKTSFRVASFRNRITSLRSRIAPLRNRITSCRNRIMSRHATRVPPHLVALTLCSAEYVFPSLARELLRPSAAVREGMRRIPPHAIAVHVRTVRYIPQHQFHPAKVHSSHTSSPPCCHSRLPTPYDSPHDPATANHPATTPPPSLRRPRKLLSRLRLRVDCMRQEFEHPPRYQMPLGFEATFFSCARHAAEIASREMPLREIASRLPAACGGEEACAAERSEVPAEANPLFVLFTERPATRQRARVALGPHLLESEEGEWCAVGVGYLLRLLTYL